MSNNTAVKQVEETEGNQDLTRRAQERTADSLSNVAERIHNGSDSTKDFLRERVTSAEEYVEEKTKEIAESSRQKLDSVNSIGHKAADFIDNSSETIRNADLSETKDKVIGTLKQRPEIGIGLAGLFGIFVGYRIGRSR